MRKVKRLNLEGTSIGTGLEGELIVANLLPGSRHLNGVVESRRSYDIIWRGIKIDVKATKNKRATPKFSHYAVRDEQVIFVYVDFSYMDNMYFWVGHASKGFKSNQILNKGIRAHKLSQAILDCHTKYSKIYNKTVDKQLSLL